MTWKINGATFAAQSLGRLQRIRSNQSPDIVSFIAEGSSFTGAALYAEDSTVTITNDDATWFAGRVIQVPRLGAAGEESVAYKAAGAWHDLERHVFKQTWKMWNGSSLSHQYKSRVILGQTAAGVAQNSGAVISEILTYAIAQGVSLQIGTITPDANIPFAEAVDITCAEAIRTVLRWTPDAVCWFDYSTTPPTFHCKRRAELTAVSVDVDRGAPTNRIDIAARTDLQAAGVVLRYEKTDVVAGNAYPSVTIDEFPDGSTGNELGAVNMTIQLAGSNLTMQTSDIVCEAIPADLNDLTWWKARLPELTDTKITNPLVHDAQRTGHHSVPEGGPDEYYANELTKGRIHSWMSNAVEQDAIEAQLDYELLFEESGSIHRKIVNKMLTYSFIATSLVTGTYKRTNGFSAGESVPTGVAEKFYNAVNPLQYEGQFVLIEDEVTGSVGMGNVLNLTNGLAAWATMKALVQSIAEDVDSGVTTVSFGPADTLGPADLIELLRANRGRKISTSWASRDTGLAEDAASSLTEEDGFSPDSAISSEGGEARKETFRDKQTTYSANIILDPTLATAIRSTANVDIQPREMEICEGGVLKKIIVLASASYT